MKKTALSFVVFTMTQVSALAGGILTNTNQSVLFLKNPARDAAIGLDGVYSNPAGVAFMPEGLHLAINWQMAHQTRTITSTDQLFLMGKKNEGKVTKKFEGVADAPVIPSVQAAYNKGNWSYQFNFSMPGGGGVCEFGDGLGSFERAVGSIGAMLKQNGFDVQGYDMDAYMRGRQYYFGVQVGAAYKVNEHLSVYGGLRGIYGDASYRARLSHISVVTSTGAVDFGEFLENNINAINRQIGAAQTQMQLAAQSGMYTAEQLAAMQAQAATQLAAAEAGLGSLYKLHRYGNGVNLQSTQTGFGFAPVIGVDYKIGNFNFAAKYEFNTEMKMKNHSTLEEPLKIEGEMANFPGIANINKFEDGTNVDEDTPAMLSVGAQWTPIAGLNINAGYHHYYDTNAKWYNDSQKLLSGGSNEYLGGVEWDASDKVNLSCGFQITRYGLTDEYMNDMSFVVNSYSVGAGVSYKVNEKITLTAAYFQTNYGDYDKVSAVDADGNVTKGDSFTRTNRVLGLGCQIDF
ncbi:MAG: transporter [Prevotella sp.]|nr:transporter [Prevotella sp.]